MNGSDECTSLYERVVWNDPTSIIVFGILSLINVMVVLGNCLVIAAVYISSKLRSVTNLFIVSLAVADLLVGVAVLPFSSTWEVYKVWIFGDIWCSIWLAVDVWMCTASILNLCAISLDRYVAVTRPVTYPSIMSSSRAKILIATVWILSFVICFPPLVGWKDSKTSNDTLSGHVSYSGSGTVRIRGSHTVITSQTPTADTRDVISYHTNYSEHLLTRTNRQRPSSQQIYKYRFHFNSSDEVKTEYDDYENQEYPRSSAYSGVPIVADDSYSALIPELPSTYSSSPSSSVNIVPCPWTCELTNDTGYVIYSALGSFFIPMGVMLFFYWRIYRAAVQTTRAINQGFRTTKGTGGIGSRFEEQRLTLRIHRGRGSVQNHHGSSNTLSTNGGNSSMSGSPSTNSTVGRSPEVHRLTRTNSKPREPTKSHEKIKISVSYPSSDEISSCAINNNSSVQEQEDKTRLSPRKSPPSRRNFIQSHFSPRRFSQQKEVKYAVHYQAKNGRETTTTSLYRSRDPNSYLRVTGARLATSHNTCRRSGRRSLSIDSTQSSFDEELNPSRRNSNVSRGSSRSHYNEDKELTPSPTFDDNKPKTVPKMGKRNIKAQVKRFRMETKAAKTLGIIVGGFILCWMPFFTMYLVRAFCPNCIHPLVFSILFWLGYFNSAINPCIYALFSKDFRFAFKKIICRCLCRCGSKGSRSGSGEGTQSKKRRGSNGSQLKVHVNDHRRSPSYNPPTFSTPNSVGEDSDPGASDSR